MVCKYEVRATIIIIILAVIAQYIVFRYVPKRYFYDDIEIKQCRQSGAILPVVPLNKQIAEENGPRINNQMPKSYISAGVDDIHIRADALPPEEPHPIPLPSGTPSMANTKRINDIDMLYDTTDVYGDYDAFTGINKSGSCCGSSSSRSNSNQPTYAGSTNSSHSSSMNAAPFYIL